MPIISSIIVPVVGIELLAGKSKSEVDGIRTAMCYAVELYWGFKTFVSEHSLPPIARESVSDRTKGAGTCELTITSSDGGGRSGYNHWATNDWVWSTPLKTERVDSNLLGIRTN